MDFRSRSDAFVFVIGLFGRVINEVAADLLFVLLDKLSHARIGKVFRVYGFALFP
jgi:hypothetical protein